MGLTEDISALNELSELVILNIFFKTFLQMYSVTNGLRKTGVTIGALLSILFDGFRVIELYLFYSESPDWEGQIQCDSFDKLGVKAKMVKKLEANVDFFLNFFNFFDCVKISDHGFFPQLNAEHIFVWDKEMTSVVTKSNLD